MYQRGAQIWESETKNLRLTWWERYRPFGSSGSVRSSFEVAMWARERVTARERNWEREGGEADKWRRRPWGWKVRHEVERWGRKVQRWGVRLHCSGKRERENESIGGMRRERDRVWCFFNFDLKAKGVNRVWGVAGWVTGWILYYQAGMGSA